MSKEADSLTQAVSQVVGEERNLNKDQVRRISEMANQETWRTLFHENGDAETDFAPVDADAVIGEMAAKPTEVQDPGDMLDYSGDVPNEKLPDDVDLAELFGVNKDTPEYEALNPVREEQEAVEKTSAAVDLARFGVDSLVTDLALKGEELYHHVKQAHIRDGHGILQLAQAVGQAMDSNEYATSVMEQITSRLEKEGVTFDREGELQKLAHPVVINPMHPLMVTAAKLEQVASAYYSAEAAHEKLAKTHRRAFKALKDKLRGL